MFSKIGDRVKSFFDEDSYNLSRTAVLDVHSGKVQWSVENALKEGAQIDSSLTVAHDFDSESLRFTAFTTKAPKFCVKSSRIKQFSTQLTVQDPQFKAEFVHKKEKYSVVAKSGYNWSNSHCDGELNFAYSGVDRFVFGGMLKVDRKGSEAALALSEYDAAVQFDRNDRQSFLLQTEDCLSKVKVGTALKVKDSTTALAQLSVDRNEGNKLDWGVGVEHCIDDNSSVSALYRSSNNGSVAFNNNLHHNTINATVAYNFDFTKAPLQRHTLEYKLVFGHH